MTRILLLFFLLGAQWSFSQSAVVREYVIEAVSHAPISRKLPDMEYIPVEGKIIEKKDGTVEVVITSDHFHNPFDSFKRDIKPFKSHAAGTKGVDVYHAKDNDGLKMKVTITDYNQHPERYIIRYVDHDSWELKHLVYLVEKVQ